ncbi:nuclear transport factor 2 family protein [Mycolicibacterium sp. CH28]|nr:nuclear transport factor 2 family protein [Mycolicibacterium sp. CH28]
MADDRTAVEPTHLPPAAVEPLRTFVIDEPAGGAGFDCRDRLAVKHVVDTYALAYDNYQADIWFDLFTEDAVFAVGVPGQEQIEQSGAVFRDFWRDRMSTFKNAGNQRRHLMSNIVYLEQTEATMHISVVGLLANTANGRTFAPVAALNYEGWLVKRHGVWKINRWHDFPDGQF